MTMMRMNQHHHHPLRPFPKKRPKEENPKTKSIRSNDDGNQPQQHGKT